jgi:predicted dehydrogenase
MTISPVSSSLVATIRIALLGADETTRDVANAIAANSRFQLAGVCEWEDIAAEVATASHPSLARARRFDGWEALLDSSVVDAVVVARGVDDDRRADQLRKLIQAEVPLLVSHPVADSMLVYYELDMIRRETNCIVLPHLPQRRHPALEELAAMVRQGAASPIGKIEQLVVARTLAEQDKASVIRQFTRDVDLMRGVAGDMTRLGAMSAAPDAGFGSLGVHMSGPEGVIARWSVVPSRTEARAQITLLGASGKVVVESFEGADPWTISISADGPAETRHFAPWNPAAASLDELARALTGEPPVPDWVDAARSVELAETIDRSLRKGRTIELYFEEYTEESTFKGTMASIGCGLLLLGMFVMGAVAIAEQIGVPYTRLWPYVLAGVLGIFLFMQLLMLVFRRGDAGPRDDAAGPQGSGE